MSESDELLVMEWSDNRVSTMTVGGERLRSITVKQSTAQDRMISLSAVAPDGEGNIFITDSQNHRVHKFTAEGQQLAVVGTKGNGPLEFRHPADIEYNKHNNKLYVVDGYHRVQMLNPDLTFFDSFGEGGQDKGQLYDPSGVACDGSGKTYVVDSYNYRIQVFTEDGQPLNVFGKRGEGDGEFGDPVNIAVDAKSRVYVSDMTRHCVSTFDPNGKFLMSFGQKGTEPGEFNDPRAMLVDAKGILFVCDFGNNRIQTFDTTNLPL